jgi:thiol-disulfide isomerase/thioredoxin
MPKKYFKLIYFFPIFLFVFLNLISTNLSIQAQSVATRTPKACHICETAYPNATQTISALPNQTITPVLLTQQNEDPIIPIYLFWGDGCPVCEKAKPYFEELASRYPQIDLQMFEIYYNAENRMLWFEMAETYAFEPSGVPTYFIGSHYWVGFSDQIKSEIESVINQCLQTGCSILTNSSQTSPPVSQPTIITTPLKDIFSPSTPVTSGGESSSSTTHNLKIPFLGSINLDRQSLLISTILISFVDGFNPCSIWVLTMLLAITLHTGSRKRVFLIGFIFITVTAGIYALFIAGLFTALSFISFIVWIRVFLALIALFFALVNIKDYFWYKEGISLTIADNKKPGIFQRMRKLVDASQSIWGLAGATAIFAAGVSLVEFSCTAGFPVLWTNLLVSQEAAPLTFVFLLLLYLVIYQLDELGIFFMAVYTLKTSKLEERHGRILKLISGILMLTLAIVMLINPSLMDNLTSSFTIFGIAFGVTLIILIIHRIVFPKIGLYIGSEFQGKTKEKARKN